MESLDNIQETRVTENDFYEIIDVESSGASGQEVLRLKEELASERERALGTLADFDNYRRRARQERTAAEQAGKREVLLALLDVMDDFDRALLHVGEVTYSVAEGLRLIRHRFNDLLHSNGVTPFDSEGHPFDPTVHEAMSVIDSDGHDSGTVYAEGRRGYLVNGELLRRARVAVLKSRSSETESVTRIRARSIDISLLTK